MLQNFRFIFYVLLILVLPAAAQAEDSRLFIGTGKVEITPPVGTPLAGYGRRHGKVSQGVHDPLYARALSLSDLRHTFVFVSADLVLVDEKLRREVLKKIRQKNPFEDKDFVFFATHTHSGPGAIGGRFWERFIMGKFRKKVFEQITNKIAESAFLSLEKPVPAFAEYGQTRIDELIENRMDEKLRLPHTLRILQFRSSEGENKILGRLIFMAAHPTILPASNFQFSADFPGVLTEISEKENPGSVAVFANGAAGDLRPKTGSHTNRFDTMESFGKALNEKIKDISFEKITLAEPWSGVFEKAKLPRAQIHKGWLRVPSMIGNRIFPSRSYFQAVRTGNLLFLALPGEIASETGFEIEDLVKAKDLIPFIIGYANDYIGYVVPRRYYLDSSQYESSASFYGPKMDWFVQRQAEKQTEKLLTEEEKKILDAPGTYQEIEGLPVIHIRGDPYHLGFEEGRLLRKQIRQGTQEIFERVKKFFPVPLLNSLFFSYVFDQGWKKMGPFVSYAEYEQMRGLADGSDVAFKIIRRIHALPEIYPTHCSNGAYWGKATADAKLIAIRNLDWNRKIGIQKYAAVKILETPGKKTYVNIGYAGFSGVLSGMNEKGISVGEIGAASSDETLKGVPMPFLLKRILTDAESLDEAIEIFKRSDRTRGYNYVIADALHREAIAVETTHNHLSVFKDQDPKEKNIPYALSIGNAVFRGDPALDPEIRDLQWASKGNPKKPGLEMPAGNAYEIRYKKQGELVLQHYGKITPEIAKQIARDIAPKSNVQSVIYAFPDFWVANAKGDLRAAESNYVHLNFEELKKKN